MSELNCLQSQRVLMEKLASRLRERFPETTEKWEKAPPSLALLGPQQSTSTDDYGLLWQPYGKGKLCQHDSNARSDLRRLQNDL